VEIRYI